MASRTRDPNISINNFNAILVNLQKNVNNYADFRRTTVPAGLTNNVQSIRNWADKQVKSSRQASRNQAISQVGNVLETSISSLQALTSDQPGEVMKGSLRIVGAVSALAAGPYGVAAGAICAILGSILSLSTPNEPDLATVFIEKVHVELQKFNHKLQSQDFEGLQLRVKNLNSNLIKIQSEGASEKLRDQRLFESDFPHFIGAVSLNIKQGLSLQSKKEDVDDCLRSMVVYCNAQMSFLLLLTNVLATFRATGRETKSIETLLDNHKQHAIETLGFLSDEKYMDRTISLSTDEIDGGKFLMIINLRQSLPFYEVVEEFREALGLTKMPELEAIRAKMFEASFSGPKNISHLYPQPQTRGDNHYFQLINHTDVPIKVVCNGIVGDHVNGLKFCKDVKPRSSYEHVATKSTWTFSTGGFFIIYFDGRMRPFESMFEGRNLKVFEFALSNPFIGMSKSAFMEKTDNLLSVSGQDCWKQMESNASKPISFVYNKKYYCVHGGYTTIYNKFDKNAGRNGCRTWRFVVQEYDPINDIEMEEYTIV